MSDKSKKIKATEDRGSLDLTRQLDESELAFKTLKQIIHNLQEENKRYKQENKNLKQQITNLEREAEEMLDVEFQGDALEIGFNVSYVLDVLNTLRCDQVRISMSNANASALIENSEDDSAMYVVMPIRL